MGSNVCIQAINKEHELKPLPEELGSDAMLLRFSDSFEFMKIVWDNCDFVELCPGHEDHYMCSGNMICRPIDLEFLKEQTAHLQPVWQTLIGYLESEPQAWLSYE